MLRTRPAPVLGVGILLLGALAVAAEGKRPSEAAKLTQDVKVKSSKDGSEQRALLFIPPGAEIDGKGEPVPLVVALHSWSTTYTTSSFGGKEVIAACNRRGWAVVAPDHRGPNARPEACASDLAAADVLDAVAFIRARARIDAKRIYLHGASGGGHMSLVMASRFPEMWAGVSAWVPITDLAAWHRQSASYRNSIAKCCGGAPGSSPAVDAEYRKRSPLFHLAAAKGMAVDINAGINDGHKGSVPISHSLLAFNVLAEANGHPEAKLTEEEIKTMTEKRAIPAGLEAKSPSSEKRARKILFQRQAGPARVTIFDGGHEGDVAAAVEWMATLKPEAKAPPQDGARR